jgi:hypothetical protein
MNYIIFQELKINVFELHIKVLSGINKVFNKKRIVLRWDL